MSGKHKSFRVRDTVEPEGAHLIGYCDGSCPVSDKEGGWGFVILNGLDTHEHRGGGLRETNNTMELTAAIELLRYVYRERWERRPLVACTDSLYVVEGLHKWRGQWVKRNFANVKNVPLWEELYGWYDKFDCCTFAWVRGHVGHFYNERADRLADMGRRDLMQENDEPQRQRSAGR